MGEREPATNPDHFLPKCLRPGTAVWKNPWCNQVWGWHLPVGRCQLCTMYLVSMATPLFPWQQWLCNRIHSCPGKYCSGIPVSICFLCCRTVHRQQHDQQMLRPGWRSAGQFCCSSRLVQTLAGPSQSWLLYSCRCGEPEKSWHVPNYTQAKRPKQLHPQHRTVVQHQITVHTNITRSFRLFNLQISSIYKFTHRKIHNNCLRITFR